MNENELEHFGVKGMHWGVRNQRTASGISSRSTDRAAMKDASEFARAKMFFGEGAGTRRKLIKATVEAKSKADPEYKKAFDFHTALQDLSTHASKARSERSRTDKAKKAKQAGGAVARRLTGEFGTTAAFVSAGFAATSFLRSPKGQSMMRSGRKQVQNFVSGQKGRAAQRQVINFLNNQG
jgi:hypothetical protein